MNDKHYYELAIIVANNVDRHNFTEHDKKFMNDFIKETNKRLGENK